MKSMEIKFKFNKLPEEISDLTTCLGYEFSIKCTSYAYFKGKCFIPHKDLSVIEYHNMCLISEENGISGNTAFFKFSNVIEIEITGHE